MTTTGDGGDGRRAAGARDPRLRELLLQYLRVRRLLDEELAPRRRARGEPRPLIGSPLYPQEAMRDLALFFYLMAVLCLLAAVAPPELGAPANPDVTPDRLLPDWYLLWAFGLLKIAPNIELFSVPLMSGKLLGVLLIVATFVGVLVVPWIDRALSYLARTRFAFRITFSEGRRPKRPMADPFMASLGAGAVVYAIMTSLYSIHEIIETTYDWISNGMLVTLVVALPFVVGVTTFAGLVAARRRGDYEWRLNRCHGCGKCDAVCPVRPVRDEPRVNLVFMTASETDDHVWTCLACDRCSAECPQGIVFSPHTLRMRTEGVVDEPQRRPQRCRDVLAWHTRSMAARGLTVSPEPGAGVGKVGYFAPCSDLLHLTRVSHDFHGTPRATVRLLEATGAQVHELPRLCCGHDALWQGDRATFERLREANVASIRASGVTTVVTECAECYRTLARDYDLGDVLVQHVSEYLRARRLELGAVRGAEGAGERPLRVAYHDPCRLGRHMEVYDAPRELVRAVPGVELVELEENREHAQCCGVAAMMNCDGASKALRVRRLEQVRRAGADVLVTTCPKCITHLVCLKDEGGDDYAFEITDLVQFLARALPTPSPQLPAHDGPGSGKPDTRENGRVKDNGGTRSRAPAGRQTDGTAEGTPPRKGARSGRGKKGPKKGARKGKGRRRGKGADAGGDDG